MTEHDLQQIEALYAVASPGRVLVVQIPEEYPPIDWIADCLAKYMQTAVWGVALDTPDLEEAATMVAITGNGPTSRANAEFYMVCHTAIPALIHECRRLRGILAEQGDAHV